MNTDEILKSLLSNHQNLMDKILFLSDDMVKLVPKDFHLLEPSFRKEKLNSFKKYSELPTNKNHWIWCGTYFKGYPRFQNKPIIKELFQTMHKLPVYQSRLKQAPLRHPACVNVFHYYSATVNRGCRSEYDLKAAERNKQLGLAYEYARSQSLLETSGFDSASFKAELMQAGFELEIANIVFEKLIKELKNAK